MAVTIENVISDIREYVGAPDTSQESTANLTAEVNKYYREIMPLQLDLPSLKGTSTITLADTDTTADLPDDTHIVFPPVRIGSGASPSSYAIGGFFTEPAYFYAKHDGSETDGTPIDILLKGRSIAIGPGADGVYKVLFPSIEKPTALVATSEIIQDRLRDIIALSASVSIVAKRNDDGAIKIMKEIYPLYEGILSVFGIKPDAERAADPRNQDE